MPTVTVALQSAVTWSDTDFSAAMRDQTTLRGYPACIFRGHFHVIHMAIVMHVFTSVDSGIVKGPLLARDAREASVNLRQIAIAPAVTCESSY